MKPNIINEFRGKYRFLSNFYLVDVNYLGSTYASVEHAYQASKFPTRYANWFRKLHSNLTPGQAKNLARTESHYQYPKEQQDANKQQIMLVLVREKFNNPVLAQALLDIGTTKLIEGNTWHDNYWGICYCSKCPKIGLNYLGEILMQVRQELRDKNKPLPKQLKLTLDIETVKPVVKIPEGKYIGTTGVKSKIGNNSWLTALSVNPDSLIIHDSNYTTSTVDEWKKNK